MSPVYSQPARDACAMRTIDDGPNGGLRGWGGDGAVMGWGEEDRAGRVGGGAAGWVGRWVGGCLGWDVCVGGWGGGWWGGWGVWGGEGGVGGGLGPCLLCTYVHPHACAGGDPVGQVRRTRRQAIPR